MTSTTNNIESIRIRIANRKDELELSYQDLSDLTGLSKSTLQRYVTGDIGKIGLDKVKILAKALKVTPGYLMGWEDTRERVISAYVSYNDPDNNPLINTNYKKVPILGTIAAGTPILAEENIEQYFTIDKCIKADFALKVKGDSMIDANILNGDIVFIHQQPTLETGEIGAFIIDDEATLKRYYKDGNKIILQPDNRNYMPIIITGGDIRIAGKLVAVLNIKD